jgi:hypothetical protein
MTPSPGTAGCTGIGFLSSQQMGITQRCFRIAALVDGEPPIGAYFTGSTSLPRWDRAFSPSRETW